jgi:hypothetical protein
MNWHQQKAMLISYRVRKYKAHILSTESVGTLDTLCGIHPTVYVSRRHVDNPADNVCRKCLTILRKESS